MSEPIKAIVINPQEKTILEISIPTKEPYPGDGFGLQLDFDRVREIINCESLEFVYLLLQALEHRQAQSLRNARGQRGDRRTI